MKIAIAPFASTFLNLYVQLAYSLEYCGHEVYFLQPDKYIRQELKKLNLTVVSYPKVKSSIAKYNQDSRKVRFFFRLHNLSNIKKVIQRLNKEYTVAKAYFEANVVDRLIVWNGDANVESDIAQELNIASIYCENGYFPNTFQVNKHGVNNAAEYAALNYNQFMDYCFPSEDVKLVGIKFPELQQSLFKRFCYRFFDSSYRSIAIAALKGYRNKQKAKRAFSDAQVDNIDLKSIGDFVFFPLQVNSDTQIVLNSDYHSMYDVLQVNLPKLLAQGYKVILKEHPDEVEPVDYSSFVDNKQVFILKKYDINQLIKRSLFTITVNSSVGLQASAANKPVVTLGKSFYLSAPNVTYLHPSDEELMIPESYGTKEVEAYIKHFKKEIFIEGKWQEPSVQFLERLCGRILAECTVV